MYFWVRLEQDAAAPRQVRHRVSLTSTLASRDVVIEGGSTTVSPADAVEILDAPLVGSGWVAVYDPLLVGGHRTAVYTPHLHFHVSDAATETGAASRREFERPGPNVVMDFDGAGSR